mmetsp:Transcript_54091/g.107384  ORF Transcript_54091/g.107384 Transcript_54091/m.107384 type:complete len:348 (+) Transcript_54091:81-1124(+)
MNSPIVAKAPDQSTRTSVSRTTTRYSGNREGELAFWPGVNIARFLGATVASSFIEQTGTYPFEVIKTRLQVSSSRQGFFEAFYSTGVKLTRELGWRRGLFRGLSFTVVTSFPVQFLYFGGYNSSLGALTRLHEKEGSLLGEMVPAAALPAAAGAMAECLSALAWIPQDQVTNRLMLGENPPRRNLFQRDSASRAIVRDLYNRGGFTRFYKGYGASITAFVPQGMIWWVVFEEVKVRLEGSSDDRARHPSAVEVGGVTVNHAVAAAAAGIVASTLTNPFDIAKTRIQTGRLTYGSTNTVGVLLKGISHEGVAVLSKGLFGRVAISIPASIFSGTCYEAIMAFCKGGDE